MNRSALQIALTTGAICGTLAATQNVIDQGCGTPRDERQIHAAWIGFRPADGQIVEVNPPRFSWPYTPGIVAASYERQPTFTLQIAKSPDMANPLVNVETTCNFYNALPPLKAGRYVFWRVGYDVGSDAEHWSRVRCFAVEPWTPTWDRSLIANLDQHLNTHPRMGFTPDNIEAMRDLRLRDKHCARLHDALIGRADKAVKEDWIDTMPAEDTIVPMDQQYTADWPCVRFRNVSEAMAHIAMAWMLTGDDAYLVVKKPLLALASYPPGGESSPEGLGSKRKWATKVTEYMGLCYDWLHPVLTDAERATVAHSLDWRIAHILNDFSWRRGGKVFPRGLAGMAGSHQYENVLWTLVGALAVYGDSEAARQFTPLVLNYLCGVTNGFGETEAWNEGVLYGNAKSASLLDAVCWAALTLPDLHIERNPYFRRIGRFFSYLTPVGIERSAWGNYGTNANTHLGGHQRNFRRLAFLTGEPALLANWQACNEVRGRTGTEFQEYLLEYTFDTPEPGFETEHQALFNTAGWAMAFSGPPSDPDTYREGVGMIFHARPRGGYSHSFNSENAFEAFAYGSVIATGGGRKSNGDRHAAATMSHNAVLVDGIGQDFDQMNPDTETGGRIVAWHAEPGLVYWCGDAAGAYAGTVPYLNRFFRHVLFIDNCAFLVFDDLQTSESHEPARFSWLYHVHQDVPVTIAPDAASFSYTVGDAAVTVRHLISDRLDMLNLRGEDGYRNPITGEDMLGTARGSVEKSPLRKFTGDPVWNNIWVTTAPQREGRFLAAILPARQGVTPPTVETLGDRHVAVTTAKGRRTVFFGKPGDADADIVVDVAGMRLLGGPQQPPAAATSLWKADLNTTDDWVLDGKGTVEHPEPGVLQINTETRTTLWAPTTVAAPALIEFDARTDDEKTRAIFFFMAEGPDGQDIFARERPNADYGDYAYAGNMELYTAGILRQGCGTEANFRRIGKLPESLAILKTPAAELTPEQKDAYRNAVRRFQPETIHDSAMDGYERGTWAHYQVLVVGGLVRVFIDGRPLFEVTYTDSLTRGRMGFRNFRKDTSVLVRNLSVSRPAMP